MRGFSQISFLSIVFTVLPLYVIANLDPYEVIGVKRDASPNQIKKAYRELVKKLHPDTSNLTGEDSSRKFIELNKAFGILRDPDKRNKFDQFGKIDEDPSLLERIAKRLLDYMMRLAFYIVSMESFFTIIILAACAIITSFFIYNSPIMPTTHNDCSDPSNHDIAHNTKQEAHRDDNSPEACNISMSRDLKLIELKAETNYGMIRLMKPGCRSIVILIDQETKDILLPKFKKVVWPYRKNKSLLFGYLCLDKNLEWYKCLLQQVLDVKELNVNKKNCIGTVLSLNGFKKYFRLFHSKHHEIGSPYDETDQDGSFLGFNNEDIEARPTLMSHHSDSIQVVGNLLDRLPDWLERTFEGLTRRYFIEEWPSEIK